MDNFFDQYDPVVKEQPQPVTEEQIQSLEKSKRIQTDLEAEALEKRWEGIPPALRNTLEGLDPRNINEGPGDYLAPNTGSVSPDDLWNDTQIALLASETAVRMNFQRNHEGLTEAAKSFRERAEKESKALPDTFELSKVFYERIKRFGGAKLPMAFGAAVKTIGVSLDDDREDDTMNALELIGSLADLYGRDREKEMQVTGPQSMGDIRKEKWFVDSANYVAGQLGDGVASLGTLVAGTVAGGPTGLVLTAWGLNAGDLRNELEDAGVTDEETLQKYTYVAGSAISALDSILPGKIAAGLTDDVKVQIAKKAVRRMAAEAGKTGLKEAVTEMLQEAIQVSAVASAAGKPINVDDVLMRMADAGVGGFLTGGTVRAGQTSAHMLALRAEQQSLSTQTQDQVSEPLQTAASQDVAPPDVAEEIAQFIQGKPETSMVSDVEGMVSPDMSETGVSPVQLQEQQAADEIKTAELRLAEDIKITEDQHRAMINEELDKRGQGGLTGAERKAARQAVYQDLLNQGKIEQLSTKIDALKAARNAEIEASAIQRGGDIPDSRSRQATPGMDRPTYSLSDLIEKMVKDFDLTKRTKRQSLKKALGEVNKTTNVIRLRDSEDFDVLSHELAHVLQNRYPIMDQQLQQFGAELIPIASPGEPLREGHAEFLRRYLTNPQTAIAAAPEYYAFFESYLATHNPTMLQSFQELQQGFAEWLKTSSAGTIARDIVSGKRKSRFDKEVTRVKDDPRGAAGYYMDELYTGIADKAHPMRKARDTLLDLAARNLGVDRSKLGVLPGADPYKLTRLLPDVYSAGHMDIMYGVRPYKSIHSEGPSLRDAIAEAFGGVSSDLWLKDVYEQFGGYLASRRFVGEYERFMRGELTKYPDKFTLGEHLQNIKESEAAYPQFVKAADMIYQYNANLLKKKLKAGFITQEQYDTFSQKPDYVPVYRYDRSQDDKVTSADGAPRVMRAEISKAFRGSNKPVINPVDSIAKDTYELSMLIARNEITKSLHKLALAAGPDGGAIAEKIPDRELKKINVDIEEALQKAAQEQGMDPEDAAIMIADVQSELGEGATTAIWRNSKLSKAGERGERIVFYWESGKRVAIQIGDGEAGHDVYNLLTMAGQENAGLVIDTLALMANAQRTGITANPAFTFTNFLRDQVSTWVLTEDFTPFVTSLKGLYDVITQKDIVRIYNSFGGMMGGAMTNTLDQSRIKRDVLSLGKQNIIMRNLSLRNVLSLMEVTETGTRVGLFGQALKRTRASGLDEFNATTEAAYVARDYFDFGRAGSKTLTARRLIPFFNASIQGLDSTRRTLFGVRDNPGQVRELLSPYLKARDGQPLTIEEKKRLSLSTKAWAKMVSIGFFGLAISMMYQDDPEYEEISDYIKATHWVLKAGDGTWVRIPKPFDLAFFSNLFERTFDYAHKDDPTAGKRFLNGLGYIMVPPYDPQVSLLYQLAYNYDSFKDRPIIPKHLEGLPPAQQFEVYSSSFSRWLGKQANISPLMIDHAIKGFGGTTGRDFLSASNVFDPFGPETAPADKFFLQRFLWTTTRGSTSGEQFWKLVGRDGGKYAQAAEGYRRFTKDRQLVEADNFLQSLDDDRKAYALLETHFKEPQQRLHPLNRAHTIVSTLNGMRKEILVDNLKVRNKPGEFILSPTEKREAIKIMSDIQNREMRNTLIVMGTPGWAGKQFMPVEPVLEELKTVSPIVYAEYMNRQKLKQGADRIVSFDKVREKWPLMKQRLLRDGEKAKLGGL